MLLFLIGAGFGCMPPLAATALQNNVSIHTFGSAVATMQFSRNLFATILVAVFGAIILSGVSQVGGPSIGSIPGLVTSVVIAELRGARSFAGESPTKQVLEQSVRHHAGRGVRRYCVLAGRRSDSRASQYSVEGFVHVFLAVAASFAVALAAMLLLDEKPLETKHS